MPHRDARRARAVGDEVARRPSVHAARVSATKRASGGRWSTRRICAPLSTRHTRAVPSGLPVSSREPSGEKLDRRHDLRVAAHDPLELAGADVPHPRGAVGAGRRDAPAASVEVGRHDAEHGARALTCRSGSRLVGVLPARRARAGRAAAGRPGTDHSVRVRPPAAVDEHARPVVGEHGVVERRRGPGRTSRDAPPASVHTLALPSAADRREPARRRQGDVARPAGGDDPRDRLPRARRPRRHLPRPARRAALHGRAGRSPSAREPRARDEPAPGADSLRTSLPVRGVPHVGDVAVRPRHREPAVRARARARTSAHRPRRPRRSAAATASSGADAPRPAPCRPRRRTRRAAGSRRPPRPRPRRHGPRASRRAG